MISYSSLVITQPKLSSQSEIQLSQDVYVSSQSFRINAMTGLPLGPDTGKTSSRGNQFMGSSQDFYTLPGSRLLGIQNIITAQG